MPARLLIVALLVLASAGLGAVELTLSPRSLTEAIDLGQSRIESIRRTFHQPYRIIVARPPVDYIDIVTPFRRIALAAETRARSGNRLFSQREALATLNDAPQQIDLLIELTFHPMNNFIGVPAYQVALVAPGAVVTPAAEIASVGRFPRFGVRTEPPGITLPYPYLLGATAAAGTQPLTGGTLLVHVDGSKAAASGAYDVVVMDAGKELSRSRIDFRALR